MDKKLVLHARNKGSIPLVPTILSKITPKYIKERAVKSRECLHYDLTEQGLCENCGIYLGL